MRFNIRAKLAATLVAGGLIPLLIAVTAIYILGVIQREQKIGLEFEDTAKLSAERISIVLTSNADIFRVLAILPVTRTFLAEFTRSIDRTQRSQITSEIQAIESRWASMKPTDSPLKEILNNRLADLFHCS